MIPLPFAGADFFSPLFSMVRSKMLYLFWVDDPPKIAGRYTACKIIRASDSLYSIKNPNGYTFRYGECNHKCFVQTAQVKRDEKTGNFEVDNNSYVCTTLDANNYPIAMSSNWWNGGYPEEWTENGVRYWAIGITATDNSSDDFRSLVGGCQLIIEASRLV